MSRIVVTNYDRFDRFDLSMFGGIDLDESGIIKSHDSKTRIALTEACAGMAFKLCCTATPASERLDRTRDACRVPGCDDREGNACHLFRPRRVGQGEGRRRMAVEGPRRRRVLGDGCRRGAPWCGRRLISVTTTRDTSCRRCASISCGSITRWRSAMASLFAMEASTAVGEADGTAGQRRGARRDAAAEIIAREPDEQWLIWCHLNTEADALVKMIPSAVEVRGTGRCRREGRRGYSGFVMASHTSWSVRPESPGTG